MKIRRIKYLKSIYITLILFFILFLLFFLIEIFLINSITRNFTNSIRYTLNFFFGIESPFSLFENVKLGFFDILIIIFGYILTSLNWIGVPILIVQYLFTKKKKDIETKEKLELAMIKAEINRMGGLKNLSIDDIIEAIERGKNHLKDKFNSLNDNK